VNSLPIHLAHLLFAAVGNEGRGVIGQPETGGRLRPAGRRLSFNWNCWRTASRCSSLHPAGWRLGSTALGVESGNPRFLCHVEFLMEACSLQFVAMACAGKAVEWHAGNASAPRLYRLAPGEGRRFVRSSAGNRLMARVLGSRSGEGGRSRSGRAWSVPLDWGGCPVIAVDHTRQALGRLAAEYRKNFVLPSGAVGGFQRKDHDQGTGGFGIKGRDARLFGAKPALTMNWVPLTLLRLEKSHQAAVIEIGTNHPANCHL